MGLCGQCSQNLAVERKPDPNQSLGGLGKQTIIIAFAITESPTTTIKCNSWDEHQIDVSDGNVAWFKFTDGGRGLQDPEGSRFKFVPTLNFHQSQLVPVAVGNNAATLVCDQFLSNGIGRHQLAAHIDVPKNR